MAEGKPYVEYVPLSVVRKWGRNPKAHDVAQIKASMERFGFVAPLLRDEATGMLVAGHGRLEALIQMRDEGQHAPDRIDAHDGEWWVPVVAGVAFKSEAEAEAYGLADNRMNELGGWDEKALAAVLEDLDKAAALEGTGYDVTDLAMLQASLAAVSAEHTRPQFTEIMDRFTQETGKSAKDGNWFYVEYYGQDETFARLCELLKPYLTSKHELNPSWFLTLVLGAISGEA